jgi:hypothetical protein
MPILGIMASSRPAFELIGSYDSLATVTLSATTASVTFAGIPTEYKHLQIRGIARSTKTASPSDLRIQFNSNTSANYAGHELYGNGTSALAYAETSTTSAFADGIASDFNSANIFGAFVIDILDYASTNKNKTVRTLSGTDANGSGLVALNSGLFYATPAAITSINFYFNGFNLKQYSSFALYGIK